LRASAGEVLFQQIAFTGPGSLPLTVAGVVYLLRDRKLRHLGLLPLALLALAMAAGQSRPDRISGMYPLLFAAGAVGIERLAAARMRWLAVAVPAWMLVFGIALAPLGAPILAPETAARYAAWLGIVPQIESGAGKRTQLPQWFADRLGWEDLVRDVTAVRDALSGTERADLAFSAPSYGQAGALEWLGRDEGLRPVFATHNNWFLWGPPERRYEVVIVVGNNRETLERIYEQVDLAMVHECGLCMPWRNGMPIWVARHPRVDIAALWPDWKFYE